MRDVLQQRDDLTELAQPEALGDAGLWSDTVTQIATEAAAVVQWFGRAEEWLRAWRVWGETTRFRRLLDRAVSEQATMTELRELAELADDWSARWDELRFAWEDEYEEALARAEHPDDFDGGDEEDVNT